MMAAHIRSVISEYGQPRKTTLTDKHNKKDTSVRMSKRLQSAPSIQPLNKDCLDTTQTTHQQNELHVQRLFSVALIRIAALFKNQAHTHT